jgi:hypothetical protein
MMAYKSERQVLQKPKIELVDDVLRLDAWDAAPYIRIPASARRHGR